MRRRTLFATVAATLGLADPAGAETITVTTTADGSGCDTITCTLRGALSRAISNGNTEPDEIVLTTGTYALNSILDLSGGGAAATRITITGAGANQTSIQPRAAGNFRVLVTAANATMTLRNLTVRNGYDVQNPGGNLTANTNTTLNLDGVRITTGTGVSGGGISAGTGSTLNIANSVIDHNSVPTGYGGGIISSGTLNVTDSTIAFNSAARAGGIYLNGPTAGATLRGVTVAYNGTTSGQPPTAGGIQSASGPVTFQGSLIAGNTSTQDTANGTVVLPLNCGLGVTPTDGGGNVEDADRCGLGSGTIKYANPQLAAALDETLQPPALPIAATSPAIDVADCGGRTFDQRRLARPQGIRCDAGAFEAVPQTQPPPTQTPTPTATPQPTPTPVVNQSVVVDEIKGTVKVKLPGTSKFVDLDAIRGIPVGSTVDAKKGTVELTSIPKAGGKPETARFYDGIFKISQANGITNLTLVEALAPCPRGGRAAAAKPKTRKLWGDGKGKFRTTGKYSAATVRGTKWLVQDSCEGTLTRVAQGSALVRDKVKQRDIVLRSGKKYLARPKR